MKLNIQISTAKLLKLLQLFLRNNYLTVLSASALRGQAALAQGAFRGAHDIRGGRPAAPLVASPRPSIPEDFDEKQGERVSDQNTI